MNFTCQQAVGHNRWHAAMEMFLQISKILSDMCSTLALLVSHSLVLRSWTACWGKFSLSSWTGQDYVELKSSTVCIYFCNALVISRESPKWEVHIVPVTPTHNSLSPREEELWGVSSLLCSGARRRFEGGWGRARSQHHLRQVRLANNQNSLPQRSPPSKFKGSEDLKMSLLVLSVLMLERSDAYEKFWCEASCLFLNAIRMNHWTHETVEKVSLEQTGD